MSTVDLLSMEQIDRLARVLGDCGTGRDISDTFARLNITDLSNQSTKWRRLKWVFVESLERNGNNEEVFNFIKVYLNPVKFVERSEEFHDRLADINEILALYGLAFGSDGEFRPREKVVMPEPVKNWSQKIPQKPNARARSSEPPGPRLSPEEIKNLLVGENGLVCSGCNRGFDDPSYLEVDHNAPRSDGGIDHISNRILLCTPCNRIKSNTLTLSGLRRENRRRGRMAD